MQFGPVPRVSNGQHGFTLIEVLFAVVLLAVLASLAAPSFRNFVAAQRIRSASYDLSSALMLARAEAIKRNGSVVVSPQGGDWRNGWTVAAGTVAVAAHEAFDGLAVDGPATNVTYLASGRAAAATRFAITSALAPSVPARCVRVDLTGMSAVVSGTGCP